MKNKKTTILLFALLFCVSFSFAFEDFNGYLSQQPINICGCSDYQDSITIENIGDEPGTYTVAAQGDLKENIILSKEVFSLSPNSKIEINYAIAKTCEKTGTYNLIFDITGKSITKRMSVPVLIKKCVNIDLKTDENIKTICPCSLVKYQFELSNTGNFNENYILDISKPFKKWSKLTVDKISLAPGQKTTLDFYVNPGCGIYGNYSSVFKVTAEKTNLAAKLPLYLFILPCYDYNITFGSYYAAGEEDFVFRKHKGDYELCEKKEEKIPVLIENNAPIPNRYDLDIKGENWITLGEKRAIIHAKNYTIIDLIARPPEELKGNYSFIIDSKTYWGDLEQKDEFNVSVNWCYTPILKTEKITVNYTKSTNKIEIQNLGIKKADYNFNIIEKPEWISLERLNITAMPNETKTINIVSEPSDEVKQGNYNLIINATTQNGVGYDLFVVIKLNKKNIIGKSYDYLKQKLSFAYGKTKEIAIDYIGYILGGIAILIVLLIALFFINKTLKKRKEAKELKELVKEKEPEFIEERTKEKKEKEEKSTKRLKPAIWKYISLFIILLVFVFIAFNYAFLQEVFKGNFTSITIYPGKYLVGEETAGEEIKETATEPFVEETVKAPEEKVKINLTGTLVKAKQRLYDYGEQSYAYGKKSMGYLKKYSYYIGFGVLGLILLILSSSFLKRRQYRRLFKERKEKTEKKPERPKKKEIKKKAEKKQKTHLKDKKDYYKILRFLLWAFVVVLLVFLISYLRNYILYFAEYIAAGLAVLILFIAIIIISKNKKARGHFKKRKYVYFSILVLFLILTGIYFAYQNKYYEKPYQQTKKWVSGISIFMKNITYIKPTEDIEGIAVETKEEQEEVKESETELKKTPEKEEKPETITTTETITEEPEEEGIVISWNQGTEHKLDLKQYFNDPDNDKLYFSSSKLENINVKLSEDGFVVLNPKSRWYGTEKVVFTADDLKGGIVKSDEITLIVKKSEEKTFLEKTKDTNFIKKSKDFLIIYYPYMIIGFILLIIVLPLLRSDEGESKKTKRNNKKKNKEKRKSEQ